MNNSLRNKKILVVGGSSGIGLAVSRQASREGADVVIASRNVTNKHEELKAAIRREVEIYSFDVSSGRDMDAALEKIGTIDHLVITTRPEIIPAPFAETDIEKAKAAFETKFWGQYRLIQKIHANIHKTGSIVMTTGIGGEKIYKNFSTMAVINGATETLCRSLAMELAPIRVNSVSPGFVAPKSPEVEKYAQTFPAGRIASPEEVAAAYIYLMTSSYATGTTVVIDGGARLM